MPTGFKSEAQLLRSLVHRKSNIACIGAFGAPSRDPTPAFLSQLTRQKAVTIVDCRDPTIEHRLEILKRKKRHPQVLQRLRTLIIGRTLLTGMSGLIDYRQALPKLGLGKNRIRLQPGLAWETGIKPASLDLVVDRGSYRFIVEQGKGVAEATIVHYLSLLKNGGKLVLIGLEGALETHLARDIAAKLERQGIVSVERERIIPSTFKINRHIIAPLYDFDHAFVLTKK